MIATMMLIMTMTMTTTTVMMVIVMGGGGIGDGHEDGDDGYRHDDGHTEHPDGDGKCHPCRSGYLISFWNSVWPPISGWLRERIILFLARILFNS